MSTIEVKTYVMKSGEDDLADYTIKTWNKVFKASVKSLSSISIDDVKEKKQDNFLKNLQKEKAKRINTGEGFDAYYSGPPKVLISVDAEAGDISIIFDTKDKQKVMSVLEKS